MNFKNIHFLKQIFFAFSFLFLLLFFFRYTGESEKNSFPEGSDNISFVLDVSQSMNTQDIENMSRLNFAKQLLEKFVMQTKGYNFALSIFAGESQKVLPFTSDTEIFSTFISGLSSDNITKQGTNIEEALQAGLAQFGKEKTGKLFLITDGDENEIQISSDLLSKIESSQVEIYIVGIGTTKGDYIPTGDYFQPYKVYNGEYVVAKLNASALKKLASKVHGDYFENALPKLPNVSLSEKEENTLHISISGYNFLLISFLFWLMYIGIFFGEFYFPHFLNYEKK